MTPCADCTLAWPTTVWTRGSRRASPKGLSRTEQGISIPLCHAHADRDPVRGLYSRLTKDGVDAWLDKAKLLPGQDWELEIRKAVRAVYF